MARGIGKFIMDCQADGMTDAAILSEVHSKFPGANTTLNSVRWYRTQGNKDRGKTREHSQAAPATRRPPAGLPSSIPELLVDDNGEERRQGQHGFYYVDQVKTFKGIETRGFNATLYAGGAKVAEVIEEGRGGIPKYHWLDHGAERVKVMAPNWDGGMIEYEVTPLEAHWLTHVARLPKELAPEHPGETTHVVPDEYVCRLVDESNIKRRLTAHMKGSVVFVAGGKVRKLDLHGHDPKRIRASIREKHGEDVKILNDMPLHEALRLLP